MYCITHVRSRILPIDMEFVKTFLSFSFNSIYALMKVKKPKRLTLGYIPTKQDHCVFSSRYIFNIYISVYVYVYII